MNVLLELLEKFERYSRLKINPTKSEVIWLAKWKNREDTPFNFKWPKESVFVLGVHFSNCKRTCDKLNFYDKLDALENTLNNWKRRKLLCALMRILEKTGESFDTSRTDDSVAPSASSTMTVVVIEGMAEL